MLSCALHLLQLAGLSPGLDPMNVDGYGGKAHVYTSAFGFGHRSWLCLSTHTVWRQNRGWL